MHVSTAPLDLSYDINVYRPCRVLSRVHQTSDRCLFSSRAVTCIPRRSRDIVVTRRATARDELYSRASGRSRDSSPTSRWSADLSRKWHPSGAHLRTTSTKSPLERILTDHIAVLLAYTCQCRTVSEAPVVCADLITPVEIRTKLADPVNGQHSVSTEHVNCSQQYNEVLPGFEFCELTNIHYITPKIGDHC